MDEIEIEPLTHRLSATVTPPGSKSITNRSLLIAAMAKGRSEIVEPLFSDDTRYMIEALQALGVVVEADTGAGRIVVDGEGGRIGCEGAELFVGGAGTAMRFLAGFVTLGRGRFKIDGDARMRQRPIGDLVEALRWLGLKVTCELNEGFPPIAVEARGADFEGGAVSVNAERSSQFVSALLMPAPLWRRGLRLRVKGAVARPFIEMTLAVMSQWGASHGREGDEIVVRGGQAYRARQFAVEADASSASYFAAAAALCGGRIRINGLRRDSLQGDVGFLQLLERMGAEIKWGSGQVEIRGTGALNGVDADMSAMPDMVPTLAVLAAFADSPATIRNVGFIRHHESDRLAALSAELRRLGAAVEELQDGLRVAPSKLKAATIQTYKDHRIAMSFAVAGLKLSGIRIADPGCVAKTYPGFFKDLAGLAHGGAASGHSSRAMANKNVQEGRKQ